MPEPARWVPWIFGLAVCLASMIAGHNRHLRSLLILGVLLFWSLSSLLMWATLNGPASDVQALRPPYLAPWELTWPFFASFLLAPAMVLLGERQRRHTLVKAGWALPLAAVLLLLLGAGEFYPVLLFHVTSGLGVALIVMGLLRQRPGIQRLGWLVFLGSVSSYLLIVWGLSGLGRIRI